MKAAIKPRIDMENRTPLQDVIPLPTPFVLFVDPANVCNLRCSFCPTGDHELIRSTGRRQQLMDFGLYKKIIDELGAFDRKIKVLRLYKEGEPLLHPRFADMVRYAKQSGCVEAVDTTTNGVLLDAGRVEAIIDAGIDRINISIDGMSDEQYLRFARTKVDFNRLVDNLRRLYQRKAQCEICIKIPGDLLSEDGKRLFYDIFGDIADRVFVENIAPCWPEFEVENRTGMKITQGIYGNTLTERKVCPYIFYSFAVNSEGSASLCFLDWERKLTIGDARSQSIKEIWNGPELKEFRLDHLRGLRGQNRTCRNCGQLTHCMPDDIDSYADVLLARLGAGRPQPLPEFAHHE
jgi:radical SAM protein with 4Fe4S-binding SPASM domain